MVGHFLKVWGMTFLYRSKSHYHSHHYCHSEFQRFIEYTTRVCPYNDLKLDKNVSALFLAGELLNGVFHAMATNSGDDDIDYLGTVFSQIKV